MARSPRPTPRKANHRESISALDRLGPAETAQLLSHLVKSHPELRSEAETLTLRMITAVNPEDVADDLKFAFSSISQEDIWEHSGDDRFGGYNTPDEAAGKLCEEALAQIKGMILGLHGL